MILGHSHDFDGVGKDGDYVKLHVDAAGTMESEVKVLAGVNSLREDLQVQRSELTTVMGTMVNAKFQTTTAVNALTRVQNIHSLAERVLRWVGAPGSEAKLQSSSSAGLYELR